MGALAYLGVDADGLAALLAGVGEDGLVALDAVGMVVAEHVALAGQRLVALPAAEVTRVPVLGHGLGVLATENQLQHTAQGNISNTGEYTLRHCALVSS